MSTVGRIMGAAGIATGLVGAAALGGMTAQRVAVRRYESAQSALTETGSNFGSLGADRSYSVVADDGVLLYVEEVGPTDAPVTIVFPHGWTLRMGSWHFQRLGLRGPGFGTGAGVTARLVFYDQRSHGKSGRAPEGHSTMEYLAADLRQVIATAAPTGPVGLIGHSMGGMAILTLAAEDPDLFAERVVGVGLVCTGATYLRESPLNQLLVTRANPAVRAITSVAARFPAIFERGRASSPDAVWLHHPKSGLRAQGRLGATRRLPRRDDLRDAGRGHRGVRPGAVRLRPDSGDPRARRHPDGDRGRRQGPDDAAGPVAGDRRRASGGRVCRRAGFRPPCPHGGSGPHQRRPAPDAGAVGHLRPRAGRPAAANGPPVSAAGNGSGRAGDGGAGPVVQLRTVDATLAFGRALGERLRAGDLVILDGALGAGKTALTKGIAVGMGVSGTVMSPTFVIARVHRPDAAHPSSVPLVHVDAYRLTGAIELDDLDLDTDLARAAVVVEWGAGVADGLSADRLLIEIDRNADDSRTIRLLPAGGDWAARAAGAVASMGETP